ALPHAVRNSIALNHSSPFRSTSRATPCRWRMSDVITCLKRGSWQSVSRSMTASVMLSVSYSSWAMLCLSDVRDSIDCQHQEEVKNLEDSNRRRRSFIVVNPMELRQLR